LFLGKKSGPGEPRGFAVFAEVFEGVLEKRGGWTWFFGGENVVDCVVNVVGKMSFFGDQKYATFLNFIFRMARRGAVQVVTGSL
jgi:hypothetical protein